MNAVSDSKRKYGAQDLQDYADYRGVAFQFTSHFPLHSLLSLRVLVANPDDRLRQVICKFLFFLVVAQRQVINSPVTFLFCAQH